jgi:mannan endo-1,4-beta-mannosidase
MMMKVAGRVLVLCVVAGSACITPGPPGPVSGSAARKAVAIAIDPGKVIGPISPYVYGLNYQKAEGLHATVRRMGGNRLTGYNWETNASNAGSDWKHTSDKWACDNDGGRNCDKAGAQATNFVDQNVKLGLDSLVTVPMVSFVTGDTNGPVSEADKAPSKRWKRSEFRKNKPFEISPDPNDDVAYQDEFVKFLTAKYGQADAKGVKFYALDNEPALWPGTHPRIHPDKPSYKEIALRTEGLASAILDVDPKAEIFGPVLYGWAAYIALQDAPDAKAENETYGTFVDYYLAKMKELEHKHGRRLVHVLDVHWYPEARGGGKRITEGDTSPEGIEARLQAPRSLWDESYVEKSWIADTWKKPIRLVPWLRERIEQRYPGTKLAFTEYDYGAGKHISGGLAHADALGVFGREGVYLATYWGDLGPYNAAAYRLFRNYDGKNGSFGDTAVRVAATDVARMSVFAATDSKTPGRMTILAINKSQKDAIDADLAIAGGGCPKAEAFRLDRKSADIQALGPARATGEKIEAVLPPMSATLFVCTR